MVPTQAVATAAQGTEVPYQVLHRGSLHTAALVQAHKETTLRIRSALSRVQHLYRSALSPAYNSVVSLLQNEVGVLAAVMSPPLPLTPAQLMRPGIG